MNKALLVLALPLLSIATTSAALEITLTGSPGSRTYLLSPDTPGQEIEIHVSGGDQIAGINFFLQVADGGPVEGGSISGPVITNVDILTGTIFDGNNNDDYGDGPGVSLRRSKSQVWESLTDTASGTVKADGLLATVTIDTTGFFLDDPNLPWDLKMVGTLAGDSQLFDETASEVDTTITNGTIAVVPEPGTVGMLVAGVLALLLMLRLVHRRGDDRLGCPRPPTFHDTCG